jgi:hypothetical protein
MGKLENILKIILEQSPTSSRNKRLIDAIQNRNPVSFYYNGPRGEVLPGRRIRVELVAMGLTKKGNLVVRGWVQPPSVSKKGFGKHGWRLFKVKNMSGVQIYEDETFNTKRPNYNEVGDNSLTTVYAKSKWGETPKVEPKPEVPPVEPKPEPETKLQQPKPKEKPTKLPKKEVRLDLEVYDQLKTKINVVDNKKQVSPDEVKKSIDDLYKLRLDDWKKDQQEIGANTIPGEGTRRRIEKESEYELYDLLKKDNVEVINQTNLQESINRIKTLIFIKK